MQIFWFGQGAIKILSKDITICIDPFKESVGLKMPRFNANILAISDAGSTEKDYPSIKGDSFVVKSPGEYEVKEVFIRGINGKGKESNSIIYSFDLEDIRIGHLGFTKQGELTGDQYNVVKNSDILFVPIGDKDFTMSAEQASKVIAQIEPSFIIPIYYNVKGLKLKLETLDSFLKEMGGKDPEIMDRLKVSKKEMVDTVNKVVILKN